MDVQSGFRLLNGKWIAPCALSMISCFDNMCSLGSDNDMPTQSRVLKRTKRVSVANANLVPGTVKVEKSAVEEEESLEIEMFGGSGSEDVDAVPDWLCSLHEPLTKWL